ncbi:MAG: anion permease [Hyphomicrobiales bacterium]
MISPLFSQLLLPFILAMFLAMNMGGSGTAPAFSAAYGSNVLKRGAIPGLFGIMVFLGAIIAGKGVAITLGKGLIPFHLMNIPLTSTILFSISISLLFANILGVPQSTSQSTVFALIGPSIYFHVFNSKLLFTEIIPTWFILPLIAFVIAFIAGKTFLKNEKKIYTGNKTKILKAIVIFTSLYVAFAIGSNNVANASGPISSMVLNELGIVTENSNFILIMILSTLVVAPNFGIGSSLFGRRVLESTGKEIIDLGPKSAATISIITASLLLLASIIKGIPSSLVQLNTAAILGIGIARFGRRKILRNSTVKKFWFIWIVAPLFAFTLSIFLTWMLDLCGCF